HSSAASALQPDGGEFLVNVAVYYNKLGAHDQAIAACRKRISLNPFNTGFAQLQIGEALLGKEDWEPAIGALPEAIGHLSEPWAAELQRGAKWALGVALRRAGRPAEALQETLTALQQDPTLAENPNHYFRYNAACFAMNCADAKGIIIPAPAKRTAYRKQALDLLTVDLAWNRKRAA